MNVLIVLSSKNLWKFWLFFLAIDFVSVHFLWCHPHSNVITVTWLSFPDKNSFWRDIWYKDHFPKEQVVFGIMISILSSPSPYLYRVNGENSYLFYFQVVTFNDLFFPISTWNNYFFFGISYYGLRLLRYAAHYGKWTS